MKKFLTLRNGIACCGVIFALVAMILTFVTKATYDGAFVDDVITNAIWNGYSLNYKAGIGASVVSMVGELLAIIGFACALVLLFVNFKDKKVKKIAYVVCGALVLVGGVLLFFTQSGVGARYAAFLGEGVKVEDVTPRIGGLATAVIAAILNILGGAAIAVSQFAKE